MPIYEYQCAKCGKVSEFLVGVGQDGAAIECKSCGGDKMNRIFSGSFISTGGNTDGAPGGGTCCGREERCDNPPCSDDGVCKR